MEIKTDTQFTRNVKCGDVYTESFADYSLPDYLGDVRKILFTEATLRPAGRFAGGDEVELSGSVVYNVVYLDADGKIASAEFASDYDYSVKCDGEKYKDSFADTRVSNYAIRVVGPRKLSARASIVGSVRLSELDSVEVIGNAFDGDEMPELNNKTVKIHKTTVSAVTDREFAEGIANIEGAIADELKIVYSCAEPTVENVEPDGSNAVICGKLRMCALIQNADEPVYLAEKSVDFEESVRFENTVEGMKIVPEVCVASIKVNVNPDDTGCNVTMSCILELCATAESNQDVSLSLDGYLQDSATENRYEDFRYNELCDVIKIRKTHSAQINKDEAEQENLSSVIFVNATPKIDSIEKDSGEIVLLGEIKYNGISVVESDGDKTYSALKFSVTFEEKVNISCQNCDKTQIYAKVSADSATASVNGDEIFASCVLQTSVTACDEKSERILSALSIREEDETSKTDGKITVYYPSSEDTLFSVAKKFRTSTVKVASDNGLAESVFAYDGEGGNLAGVKRLIIY